MSTKYKALDIDQAYFITITTVGWVDIFTRLSQKMVIIDSLKYCQTQKRGGTSSERGRIDLVFGVDKIWCYFLF